MIKTYIENSEQAREVSELGKLVNNAGAANYAHFPFAFWNEANLVNGYPKSSVDCWDGVGGEVVRCRVFISRIKHYLAKRTPRKVTMAEVCAEFGEEVVIEKGAEL